VIPPPANAFHPGLERFEVFDVARSRLGALRTHLVCTALPFSIHAPLVRQRADRAPSAVFFLTDSPERETSFTDLAATLEAASVHHAQYVVTHLNWTKDTPSERRAEALAYDTAARLVELSRRYRVPLHLECGGYSGGFHRADQFAALAAAFPELGLCVDVGHLWLIAQERGRSAYREIETLAPHARSLHLWAARDLATYRRHGHLPLHPALSAADGWLDLGRAVAPVLAARPESAVIFEFTWEAREARGVREGLDWAEGIVRRAASGAAPLSR
jgi:sugar phosphate isomerase/epimerase